jgi:hypothetical protein
MNVVIYFVKNMKIIYRKTASDVKLVKILVSSGIA